MSTWDEVTKPRPQRSGAERTLAARKAAAARWSRLTAEERTLATAAAREAMEARHAAAPNPKAAREAYFAGLHLAAARANRRRPA